MNEPKTIKTQSDFQILVEEFRELNSDAEMLIDEIFNYCRNLKGFEPEQKPNTEEPLCEKGVLGVLQCERNKLIKNNTMLRVIRNHLAETIGH